MDHYKYLKYKTKYLKIKEMIGGTDIILHSDQFIVNRNNSIIVPKNSSQMFLEIRSGDTFYLKLSSLYVPQADGLVINDKLNELEYAFWGDEMRFVYDDIEYLITILIDKRRKKIFDELTSILEKNRETENIDDFPPMDSLPITSQHHFGTLILFTEDLLKDFKPNNKYYMVRGNQWHHEYTGKYHITIMEYQDNSDSEDSETLGGRMCTYDSRKKTYVWYENLIRLSDGTDMFVYGGGDDPVHIIYDWNPKFKIPKIPCAKNALIGKEFLTKKIK